MDKAFAKVSRNHTVRLVLDFSTRVICASFSRIVEVKIRKKSLKKGEILFEGKNLLQKYWSVVRPIFSRPPFETKFFGFCAIRF